MIIEDIANLITELHKTYSSAKLAKIFNRERKWVYSVMNGCTVKLDYDFIIGLSSLGYELKIVKKLTDSEIVKVDVIETLNNADGMEHISIICFDRNGENETVIKVTDIIETLNRQKAEIERLEKARQKQAQFLGEERGQKYELLNKITNAKTEAIKEFAEKLKCRSHRFKTIDRIFVDCIPLDYIDNLVKETVGDENA